MDPHSSYIPTRRRFLTTLGGTMFALAAPAARSPEAALSLGDDSLHPKPLPAPALPAAGGTFADPTYGSTILRLTDPLTAPAGASVNSASQDSMFNATGTLFYLHHAQMGTLLYGVDPVSGRVARLGHLPASQGLAYDGAAWDPTDPNTLYAIVMSTRRRELWQLTLPLPARMTLLHDFSREIPTGGYPYSRVQVGPEARHFAVTASSVPDGGQDQYDYVVVWERRTGDGKVWNTVARSGTRLHSIVLDEGGEYVLAETGDYTRTYIWHWPTDTLSPPLGIGAPYHFGGHKVIGNGEVLSPGAVGGSWVTRRLSTPDRFTEVFRYPRRAGRVNWFEDSHSSRLLSGRTFFQSRYVGTFTWGRFARHAGQVYGSAYVQLLRDFNAPEVMRYRGRPLDHVATLPTAPNQWSYDSATDMLDAWLPDGTDPETNRQAISIFDWRPLMEEVIQLLRRDDGTWTWRRLAHHRSQWTGEFGSSPRANAAPTGSYVLFQSNWDATLVNRDGSARQDVFLITVPENTR
jgi:hypothetical protein